MISAMSTAIITTNIPQQSLLLQVDSIFSIMEDMQSIPQGEFAQLVSNASQALDPVSILGEEDNIKELANSVDNIDFEDIKTVSRFSTDIFNLELSDEDDSQETANISDNAFLHLPQFFSIQSEHTSEHENNDYLYALSLHNVENVIDSQRGENSFVEDYIVDVIYHDAVEVNNIPSYMNMKSEFSQRILDVNNDRNEILYDTAERYNLSFEAMNDRTEVIQDNSVDIQMIEEMEYQNPIVSESMTVPISEERIQTESKVEDKVFVATDNVRIKDLQNVAIVPREKIIIHKKKMDVHHPYINYLSPKNDNVLRKDHNFSLSNANVVYSDIQENNIRSSASEQVVMYIEDNDFNTQKSISLQLIPAEEFGQVDVSMVFDEYGKASISIVTEKQDTLQLLQRDHILLENAFQKNNLEMHDISFNLAEDFPDFSGSSQYRDQSSGNNSNTGENASAKERYGDNELKKISDSSIISDVSHGQVHQARNICYAKSINVVI